MSCTTVRCSPFVPDVLSANRKLSSDGLGGDVPEAEFWPEINFGLSNAQLEVSRLLGLKLGFLDTRRRFMGKPRRYFDFVRAEARRILSSQVSSEPL
jgi:hypothetical protein